MTYLSPIDIIALTCQLPITVLAWRREPSCDRVFWFLLVAAFLGPLIWSISVHYPVWRGNLPAALWTSIAVTWGVFLLISTLTKDAWRLVAVIAPILLVMGVLAVISSGNSWKESQEGSIIIEANASLSLHIAVSLVTYSLVTIASAAGYAGIIQGRALKSKQPTPWTRELPALSRCDAIMFKFLTIAEIVLAIGLLSGMALQYQDSGKIISFDHKTVLTLIAFSLIGAVLIVHRLSGLRGRVAARWSLSAYLFLTLGYLGVKLVTDILLD